MHWAFFIFSFFAAAVFFEYNMFTDVWYVGVLGKVKEICLVRSLVSEHTKPFTRFVPFVSRFRDGSWEENVRA